MDVNAIEMPTNRPVQAQSSTPTPEQTEVLQVPRPTRARPATSTR